MDKREFQELKKRFAKETKRKKISKYVNFITTFLSVLGIVIISYYIINDLNLKWNQNNIKNSTIEQIQKENDVLIIKIKELQEQLENNSIDTLQTITLNKKRISTLENKIETLEKIITDSPEKALTIPLLSKDIEHQKIDTENKIELIQDKITTVVDLNKWILGLIFSLLITIVISNILGFNRNKNKSETE
jgi:predicted PurR-regulated permease PerM